MEADLVSIEFLVTSLVVVVLPGTGVLYTVAVALGRGFRASVAAAFGCTLGILPAALASIIGLAALLHTSAMAFQVIKFVGVAYLIYMAWGMLRQGGTLELSEDRGTRPVWRIIVQGLLLNVLNPKLSLFFLAFLPQFVDANRAGATGTLAVLALIFMGLTFVVFGGYGAGASLARDYVIARPAVQMWLRRSFAGIFAVLSVKLAFAVR